MLTETTKHALRALVVLAGRPEGERMLGRDLAVAAKTRPNYLAKILLSLRRAGRVRAKRGGGGGYALAAPPGPGHAGAGSPRSYFESRPTGG